jgi:hypothetical protein
MSRTSFEIVAPNGVVLAVYRVRAFADAALELFAGCSLRSPGWSM